MHRFIKILFFAAIASVALAMLVAFLYRFGLIESLGIVTSVSLFSFAVGILVLVSSIFVMFIKIVTRKPNGLFTAFGAFFICFSFAGYGAVKLNHFQTFPPIHNVSTDLEDPPGFSQAMVEARGESVNPLPMSDQTKQIHADFYTDLTGFESPRTQEQVYATVRALVVESGWEIVSEDQEGGMIEATARTFWLGFRDDVSVRVRTNSETAVTKVDLRSVSRIGLADLGENSRRIKSFLNKLESRLKELD